MLFPNNGEGRTGGVCMVVIPLRDGVKKKGLAIAISLYGVSRDADKEWGHDRGWNHSLSVLSHPRGQ